MRRVNLTEIGVDQDNYFIHLARYMFCARQLSASDQVLEIGCGTGYGARLLADHAAKVYATDRAPELVEAWGKLVKSNLHFFQGALPNIKFDCVVSFEVVEHIVEDQLAGYFSEIKNALKPTGAAYFSTPRALAWEDRSENRRREHVKEYSPEEFRTLLRQHFSRVFLFAQNDSIISTQNLAMAWNLVAIAVP